MQYETIVVERQYPVAVITLNRPQKLNALNSTLLGELGAAIQELRDDPAVRVVILTGSGEKAFAAGGDLEEIAGKEPYELWKFLQAGQDVFRELEAAGKPVIGAINGMALGGGAELALACTLRVASENASFSFPEAGLGGLPGYGGTQRLPRLIGKGLALEYLLTGDPITAQQALALHLVNRVVPLAALMDSAQGLAKKLAGKAPVSVQMIMKAVSASYEVSAEWGCLLEAGLAAICSSTGDSKEGISAVRERRKPVFQGK